jgi:hypothetical protein
MTSINPLLWEGTLPNLTKDNLHQVVQDFCVGSSCYVRPLFDTAGHYKLQIWGITKGNREKTTLEDLSIAEITFYEPTNRVKVFLNDLENEQNPSEQLMAFLYDLPFGVRDRIEHLVWWILDKYVGRSKANAWQQQQNLETEGDGTMAVPEQGDFPEGFPKTAGGRQKAARAYKGNC